MTTVHILTKNNGRSIRAALDSVAAIRSKIIVGDLGSTDDTKEICQAAGAVVHALGDMPRNKARNALVERAGDGPHFYIEPWEAVVQGHNAIRDFSKRCGQVRVMQGKMISFETRFWGSEHKFINPVFERVDVENPPLTGVALVSNGGVDLDDATRWVEWWKNKEPLKAAPHYYQSCVLLAKNEFESFMKTAEHYLFMQNDQSMPVIMTRYYYAMTCLLHKRDYKPALQNLNLCLCHKPLMSEFWCLMGDVYYHLLHRFEHAKEHYENALLLGSLRLSDDRWPMHIDKYRAYPTKMIESCNKLIGCRGYYGSNKPAVE